MSIRALEKLAEHLDEPAHLVIWERGESFEVVALNPDDEPGFQDAFPLPLAVQSAAAEAEMILNTRMAAKLEVEQMPADFWEGLEAMEVGERLRISRLGRAGRKYLEVFAAVEAADGSDLALLRELEPSENELAQIARWLREKELFDHRAGDRIMAIFLELQS